MEPNITDVKFLPSARADLDFIKEKNIKLCHEIVARCRQLQFNPLPKQAEIIKSCSKKGYKIHRLKRVEFPAYRVLYAIDELQVSFDGKKYEQIGEFNVGLMQQ